MKNLPYAVVKFPVDNLVGVICTKWITPDEKHCLYPASKPELFNMSLILKKEKEAMPGWDKHPIVILGQYATFAEAKEYESKAEDTSNLSEDDEGPAISKRKRRPTRKYDDSDENRSPSPPLKKSKKPKHPPLLSFAHVPSCTPPLQETSQIGTGFPTQCPSQNQLNEVTYEHLNSENAIIQSETGLSILTEPSTSNLLHQAKFCTPPQKKNYHSAFSSPIHNDPYTDTNQDCSFNTDIDIPYSQHHFSTPTPRRQQRSNEHSQVMDKLNHLIEMVSALSQRVDQLGERVNQLGEHQIGLESKADKSEEIFTLLPIKDMTGFDHIEKRLAEEEVFRKSFVKAMSTLGGRDPNTLTINILKVFIQDEAAELFSLTGKKMGNFRAKRKFSDTRVCNAIFDAVRRRHKEATNDILKNTVKHWLQQATPRIQKRGKKQEAGALGTGEAAEQLAYNYTILRGGKRKSRYFSIKRVFIIDNQKS